MTIFVRCQKCTAEFRFKDEAADRVLACPYCSEPIQVPSEPNFDGSAMEQEFEFFDHIDESSPPTNLPPKILDEKSDKATPVDEEKKDLRWAVFVACGILAMVAVAFTILKVLDVGSNEPDDKIAGQSSNPDESNGEVQPGSENDVEQQTVPEIPGAVSHAPKWMLTKEPFDVGAFFRTPKSGQNAEPLYLDAFFEVSATVGSCFPEEQRDERTDVVRKRARYFIDLYHQWKQQRTEIDGKTFDGCLQTYSEAFKKLADAQQRNECVFRTSIDFSPATPHVRAAREFVSVFEFKISRQLKLGDVKRATESAETVLRLIRDLRRRAIPSTQLAAVEMEVLAYRWVPWILSDSAVHVEDCDRILEVLTSHGAQSVDPFLEAVRADYCMVRKVLHDVENKVGSFSEATIRDVYQQPNASVGMIMASFLFHASAEQLSSRAARIDAALKEMTPEHFQNEVTILDEGYGTLLGLRKRPYRDREAVVTSVRNRIATESKLLGFAASLSAIARSSVWNETLRRGLICLVALRRWKLQYTDAPSNLAAVVQDAGVPVPPIDPFSGGPFRMGTDRGGPIVYSVGRNGRDDRGVSENPNDASGKDDILFRLNNPQRGSSTAPVDF